MIIFLYGSDGYRLRNRTLEIIDSYRKKHKSGLNFFKFDCVGMGLDEFKKIDEAVKNSSFFNEVKLIILRNPISQKIISGKIEELIKKYDLGKTKDTVILAVEHFDGKLSSAGDMGLFETLKKPGNLVENINCLEGVKLTNWIKNEFAARDCAVEPAALRKLVDYAGNDSYSLVLNIDKLTNYLSGDAPPYGETNLPAQTGGKKILKPEIVDLLITQKAGLNIFDLVDAIASKNKARAFDILYKELKTGRDANYILTMIIFQFRNLLMVKDLASRSIPSDLIAKKSGLHPFVVKKAMRELGKYEMNDLKSIYGRLLNADVAYKNGKIAIDDSLFNLVFSI